MNKLLLCVALLGMGVIYGARAEDPPATAADDLIATRQADMAIQTSLLEAIMMAIGADADIVPLKDAADAIEALGMAIPELFPEGTERGLNTGRFPPSGRIAPVSREPPAIWRKPHAEWRLPLPPTIGPSSPKPTSRRSQRAPRATWHIAAPVSNRSLAASWIRALLDRYPVSLPRGRQIASWDFTCAATYPAISRVARIGNFKTLHNALRFASRGRQWSVSQK